MYIYIYIYVYVRVYIYIYTCIYIYGSLKYPNVSPCDSYFYLSIPKKRQILVESMSRKSWNKLNLFYVFLGVTIDSIHQIIRLSPQT